MNAPGVQEEIEGILQEYEREPQHVRHVAFLALQLFDQLVPLHQLFGAERLHLQAAALLHDIGWSVAVNGAKHHKESARLIRSHQWQHLDLMATERIAFVARYHRKSLPKPEHTDFMALPETEQATIRFLAAILRVADGADRSHLQRVERIHVNHEPGVIIVQLLSDFTPLTTELAGAARKADLMQLAFGRQVVFVQGLSH